MGLHDRVIELVLLRYCEAGYVEVTQTSSNSDKPNRHVSPTHRARQLCLKTRLLSTYQGKLS